jgi:hypothetical protein
LDSFNASSEQVVACCEGGEELLDSKKESNCLVRHITVSFWINIPLLWLVYQPEPCNILVLCSCNTCPKKKHLSVFLLVAPTYLKPHVVLFQSM